MIQVGYDAGLFHTDPAIVQQKAVALQAQPAAQPTERSALALIDTGAFASCIDEDLAQELQLPLIDQQYGCGIGGAEKFNVYLAYIRIALIGTVQWGRFMGVKLRAAKQPHQALLGRTLLQTMILVYDGRDGSVRLAV